MLREQTLIRAPKRPGPGARLRMGGTVRLAAIGFVLLGCVFDEQPRLEEPVVEHREALAAANLVANPSLETANPANANLPLNWARGGYGTNTASFAYVTGSANSGNRSVRVNMTSYSSGDAKWYFDPINVTAEASYIYRDAYKATIPTKIVAVFTLADGSKLNRTLANVVPANARWSTIGYAFTAPTNSVTLTVYHLIAGVGTLELDDAYVGAPDAPVPGASTPYEVDGFCVRKLYPTPSAGREWLLPPNAETPSNEWNVETNPVTRVSDGVFHTVGNQGETRLTVGSPSGKAWWRNVEMTGYYRYTAPMDSFDQERHWELVARSERHSTTNIVGTSINGGVAAPFGTAIWPGYPFGTRTINSHCLGASYHGNFYVTREGLFEKEISHSDGYAPARGRTSAAGFLDPLGRWFGMKFVLRNQNNNQSVHLELWLDANADGNWTQLSASDDKADWSANNADINGCGASPFSYAPNQLIRWAGPWVIFRSDSIAMDFRWLSAREISPLP